MITICLTYFRSLTLANLDAALYSVRQQDLSRVSEIVVVDNNTNDATIDIQARIDAQEFPIPVRLISEKHGDKTKTHPWSSNVAVRAATTDWVLFTRADYILDFDAVRSLSSAMQPNTFIVGGYYDVTIPIGQCEQTDWRQVGPGVLRFYGREYGHVLIDAGVWMTTRQIFESVGGLDESMYAWGHAQTVFQHRLYKAGVHFARVAAIVFYHPAHDYEQPRDHAVAREQLATIGFSLEDMWSRYHGPDNPYR